MCIRDRRYYDEAGLLRPACTDPATGYRLYTTDQLVRLHRIQALRQVGLSIDEVRLILQGSSQEPFLQRRRAQLTRELSADEDMLSRVEFMLTNEEDFFMNYQAIIKELPECIVYSKRMTIPSYDSYFSVIPAIGEQVSAKYPDLRCTCLLYTSTSLPATNSRAHIPSCEATTHRPAGYIEFPCFGFHLRQRFTF